MPKRRLLVASSITLLAAMPIAAQRGATPAAPAMVLTVAGFQDGGDIPVKFSQAAPDVAPGEGLSPAISWTNVPAGTQSFVLNMRDMDVARNKTTDDQAHWVVWNIPATATGLPEGYRKVRSWPTAPIRSVRPGLCIAGRARVRTARSTTTCSSSTRWMQRLTCSRRPTPLRHARTS